MKVEVGDKLGGGAFGDVYRGRDEIGREVAVKIIRPDDATGAQALLHAKALAKVNHPNIVRVYSVERVDDPVDTTKQATGVVMELIEGDTLTVFLQRASLSLDQARELGQGLINGLEHLIQQGLAHGDLHSDNVMVCDGSVRIIDIALLSGSGSLSTASRESRLKKDLLSLRLILQEILQAVHSTPGKARAFNDSLDLTPSLKEIAQAFGAVVEENAAPSTAQVLTFVTERLQDPEFVAGEDYATALVAEIPKTRYAEVMQHIVDNDLYQQQHKSFVTLVWRGTADSDRKAIGQKLSKRLDDTVPGGPWSASIQVLAAMGREGWESLSALTQLRLENAITKDILNGFVDIFAPVLSKGGALGTWCKPFFWFFKNPSQVIDNIVAMLERNWYTQNYVGEYLLTALPSMAKTNDQRKAVIAAIASALRNDAKIVQRKLDKLPAEWVREANAIAFPPESSTEG